MIKSYIIFLLMLLLISCSSTPNEIMISTTPGVCMPNSNGINYAPYCMMITLQNNNTGENANNVQVTNLGITLNYTVNSSNGIVNYNSILCDNFASGGVCPIGTSQVGNIVLKDPNNCATQQGARVTTLMADGGTCSFYLQIVSESYAVGNYPVTITYNYTNANQNYAVSTVFNQTVNLISGAGNGLFVYNNKLLESINSKDYLITNISNIIRDNLGYFYFNSNNNVYQYNGIDKIFLLGNLNNNIKSLLVDSNNNLLAIVNNDVIYYTNITNKEVSWKKVNIIGVSLADLIGMSSVESQIYISDSSNIVGCFESISNNNLNLICSKKIAGKFSPNTISFNNYLLYESNNNLFNYDINTESIFNFTQPNINNNSYISTINYNFGNIVFGISSLNNKAESSLYYCNESRVCNKFLSESLNVINGNILSVTSDNLGNIYLVGESINSKDITINYTNIAYINNSINGYQKWQTINGNLLSPKVIITGSNLNNLQHL